MTALQAITFILERHAILIILATISITHCFITIYELGQIVHLWDRGVTKCLGFYKTLLIAVIGLNIKRKLKKTRRKRDSSRAQIYKVKGANYFMRIIFFTELKSLTRIL